MSNIGTLATSIFENEFDSTGVTVVSISGWLENNIGQLNNLLYKSFSGISGEVPGLGLEEQNIYKELYLYHYYFSYFRHRCFVNSYGTNLCFYLLLITKGI